MRVGPRVWKTALAVTLAIMVSRLLGLELPVFAGVAAIICMQPTIAGSLRKGVERMQATIIGAVFSLVALIAIDVFGPLQAIRPGMIGLTVLIVMAVTLWLGWLDSLVLAAATVVVIMVLPAEENIYAYSLSRTVITFIGIVVASVVNALFLTPSHSRPLQRDLAKLLRSTTQAYRLSIEAFCSRDVEKARDAELALAETEELLDAATTRMRWVDEEERLRKRVPYSSRPEVPVRQIELVTIIRHATATIARITLDMLERSPRYAENDSRVYDIICELANPSFLLLEGVEKRLTCRNDDTGADHVASDDDLHKRFIAGLRDHCTDVYPLVEVSVVEFEIRQVTEAASAILAITPR